MEDIVGIKIVVDGSESTKSIGEIRKLIQSAQDDVGNFTAKFGETSKEVEVAKLKFKALQESLIKAVKPVGVEELKNTLKSIPQLNFKGSEIAIDTLLNDSKKLQGAIDILKDSLGKVDSNQGFSEVVTVISTLQNRLNDLTGTNKTVIQSFDAVAKSLTAAFSGKITLDTSGLNIDEIGKALQNIPELNLGQSEEQLQALINDAGSLKGIIESLKVNLDTATSNDEIVATTAVINTLNTKLNEISSTSAQVVSVVDSSTAQIKDDFTQVDLTAQRAAESINSFNKELIDTGTADNNLEQLTKDLSAAQINLDAAKEQFGEFSSEAILASEKVLVLKVSIANLSKDSVQNIEQLKTELASSESNVESLQSKFVEAGTAVEQAVQQVSALKEQLATAEGAEQIAALSEQIKVSENNLTNLNSQFLTTSQELINAKDKTGELKDQVDNYGKTSQSAFSTKPIKEQAESVGTLKSRYKEAVVELQKIIEKYGYTSIEAAKAAKAAAGLKDEIGDANTLISAFNPEAKFQAFSGSIQGVVGGFAALQGALATFGVKNQEVEKSLLKVQAALALSQGLNSVFSSIDAFKALALQIRTTTILKEADIVVTKAAAGVQRLFTGTVVATSGAFKALKVAIASTGIGALVVILGSVISKIIDYTSSTEDAEKAQKKFNDQLERQEKILQNNLEAIDNETKQKLLQAKIAGATEQQLNQIQKSGLEKRLNELKQTNSQISKEQLANDVNYKISAEKREENATKLREKAQANALELRRAEWALDNFDLEVKDKNLSKKREIINQANNKIEADTEAAEKQLRQIRNENENASIKDSLELAETKLKQDAKQREKDILATKASDEIKKQLIVESRKKLNNDLDKLYEDTKKKELESLASFQKTISDITFELKKPDISALDLAKKEVEDKYADLEKQIEKIDTSTTEGIKKRDQLLAELKIQKGEALAKAEKDVAEKSAKSINELDLQYLGEKLKNSNAYREAEIQAIELDYDKRIELAKQNGENVEQLERNKNAKIAQVNFDFALGQLEAIINNAQQTFDARKEAIDQEQLLLEEKYLKDQELAAGNAEALKAIDEQYTKDTEKLSQDRMAVAIAEKEHKAAVVNSIVEITNGISGLAKTLFEKDKGVQIAALVVEQIGSVAKIIANTSVANAKTTAQLGVPAAIPFVAMNTISAGISIAALVAQTAKSIQQIRSTNEKSASAGVGGAKVPQTSTAAPMNPQVPQQATTQLNQQSINQIGSAVFGRSYVLESDVTNQQERQRRLNRAARLI